MTRQMTKKNWVKILYSTTSLGGGVTGGGVSFPGGLDLTTPTLKLQPGACRDMVNFQCNQTGGYGRIPGYERFDGHPSPSAAQVTIVQINAYTNTPTLGQTLTQATSGATGKIIVINASPPYMALTSTTGTFDQTHNVSVGATLIGTAVIQTAQLTVQQIAQYAALAANQYRGMISAVPGSGPIRGVVGMIFGGVDNVYAFRDNVGATAGAIYKATTGGWVNVPLYDIVSFTGGGTAVAQDGDVLTQGGNAATIKRVMTQTGAWTGTAAGQFVITTPTPGSFTAGAASTSSGATVTLAGAETAITIQPGGKYEFTKYNFGGAVVTKRIYGADGVNKAFEFDGDVYAPITTGNSPDNPKHITSHKGYLILSFGASLDFCAPGLPFVWDASLGAGEIATGDTVSGMVTMPGSQTSATLAVFQDTNTGFLYGTSKTDFNLVMFNTGIGAVDYSVQNLFDSFVLDNLGVITLKTTLNYGNFLPNTLTRAIQPFINQERSKVTGSCVSRDNSQYRLFFSDGYALWITVINAQYLGPAVILFPNPVNCVDEVDLTTGGHATYFGSNDGQGYVYQMDVGTSFDGASIYAYITLAWDYFKNPRILKRYRAASVEIDGTTYAEISFGYQLAYGNPLISQPTATTYASNFANAPLWDQFVWDNFIWDGRTLFPTEIPISGTAENIQVTISSNSDYFGAFSINSIIYHYNQRRGIRV